MMTPAQEMMRQMLMQQQQQLQQNPINQGTLQGMQAAKQSIQMDEMDKNRAMGLGMFNMGTHLGNQNLKFGERPRDAFQLISHALPHGVEAYLGEEDRAKNLNATLLARQMEQQERKRREELRLAQMGYKMEREQTKEAQDKAYKKRYLDIMAGRAGLNEGAQEAPQRMVEFNDKKIDLSKYSPIETPAQLNAYSKESRVWGQVVKDMKSIKKDLDKMEKMTEKNIFAPYGSVFKELPNIGKDYVSRLAGPETENEKLQDINKEVTLRGDLISKFTSLEPILERASKGGVPDAQMLARFKDLRVYLSKDEPIDRLQYRLKRLLEDAEDRELSSKASLKFKHEIDSLKGGEGKEAAEEAIDMDSLINNLRSRSPTFAKMSDEEARKWIEQGNYDKTHQLMRISEGSAK